MVQDAPIVLGLDVATRATGWAAVQGGKRLASGVLRIGRTKDDSVARLVILRRELVVLLERYRPALVAVEAAMAWKSIKTTMRLSEAQGVAIEAAAGTGARILHPQPEEWRKALGCGGRDKERTAQMVRLILGGYSADFATDDESDALGLALYGERQHQAMLAETPF